jgi:hypothetical protein
MCLEVSGVAEVAEGRWWLECGPGRAGVAGSESQELLGVGQGSSWWVVQRPLGQARLVTGAAQGSQRSRTMTGLVSPSILSASQIWTLSPVPLHDASITGTTNHYLLTSPISPPVSPVPSPHISIDSRSYLLPVLQSAYTLPLLLHYN